MLVTVVDRKEYKLLNSHCFCTLYEGNFSFPIYLNWTSVLRRAFIMNKQIFGKQLSSTEIQSKQSNMIGLHKALYSWLKKAQTTSSRRFLIQKIVIIQNKTLTVFMGSSGRPVAQSITVWTPTNVAGIVSGLLRSACLETLYIDLNWKRLMVWMKHSTI